VSAERDAVSGGRDAVSAERDAVSAGRDAVSGDGVRVVVTGGAGFIGSNIVEQLLEGREGLSCREVVVLDNFSRGRKENLAGVIGDPRLRVVEGDIMDRALVAGTIKDVDLVFHQAAIRITQCAETPRLAVDIHVNGTYNVLEACVASGVKKVLAASSASVYGMADVFPTEETHHPYNNRTLYGATKVFNEGLLRSFHEMYGLQYVAVRPFNVYGPRMDTHGAYTEVFIRWMQRIVKGLPPLIFGDGSQTMDFIYVGDVARLYLLAAKSPVTDEVFNAGSGAETSLRELAEELVKVMGARLAPELGPERKVNPVRRRIAGTEKARRMLGFETSVSLTEGLRRLAEWWLASGHDKEAR
jgi:UDP-glucose 4-epimerase